MLLHISMFLLSIAISAVVGLALFSSRDSIVTSVRDGIISGTIGALALTAILLQYELASLREIRNQIISPNQLAQLDEKLKKLSTSSPMRSSIVHQKEKIETDLSDIIKGQINLRDGDDVILEWKRLFKEAKTSVYATNYITPSFWLGGSDFSKQQFDVQSAARKLGVTIRRIFIYNGSSAEELDQIRKLSQQQRLIGIETRFFSYEKLRSSEYFNKHQGNLHGAVDFVIYDTSVTLLSFPNSSSRRIESGLLSNDRQVTDAAIQLFDKLWIISEEKV